MNELKYLILSDPMLYRKARLELEAMILLDYKTDASNYIQELSNLLTDLNPIQDLTEKSSVILYGMILSYLKKKPKSLLEYFSQIKELSLKIKSIPKMDTKEITKLIKTLEFTEKNAYRGKPDNIYPLTEKTKITPFDCLNYEFNLLRNPNQIA